LKDLVDILELEKQVSIAKNKSKEFTQKRNGASSGS
jgi:hypothetical protein